MSNDTNCSFDARQYFQEYFNEFCIQNTETLGYICGFTMFIITQIIIIVYLFKLSVIKINQMKRVSNDMSTWDKETKPTYCILSLY